MARRITGGYTGKVICDAIHTAEVIYKDKAGNILFSQEIGLVTSGGTIQRTVPRPEHISILVEGD